MSSAQDAARTRFQPGQSGKRLVRSPTQTLLHWGGRGVAAALKEPGIAPGGMVEWRREAAAPTLVRGSYSESLYAFPPA